MMIRIVRYALDNGRVPFTEWLAGLRDSVARAKILNRLDQLKAGNFGDTTNIGHGIIELRIHYHRGYRVYLGRHGDTLVVLLNGGDKSTQSADIRKAQRFWIDWKRRHV
jgi:putative addiction module killer protein